LLVQHPSKNFWVRNRYKKTSENLAIVDPLTEACFSPLQSNCWKTLVWCTLVQSFAAAAGSILLGTATTSSKLSGTRLCGPSAVQSFRGQTEKSSLLRFSWLLIHRPLEIGRTLPSFSGLKWINEFFRVIPRSMTNRWHFIWSFSPLCRRLLQL